MLRIVTTTALAAAMLAMLAALSGCTAQAFCNKKQECDDKREDDDPSVCVAEFNRNINVLRANKEDECQKLADATIALASCEASLDCDDFQEADLGQKCDNELDDFRNANDDARSGNEFQCNSFD